MKRSGILHADLARLIASLGHGDRLVIADAGLPIPRGVACIDLALSPGIVGFADALRGVLVEMQVERALMAEETARVSPAIDALLQRELHAVVVERVTHERFKEATATARAVVRTGEFTPYANVMLVAGVVF